MIIRPEAEADLANTQGWYEWQREGLGAEFLLCVEEIFERIGRMPELHPVVYRGVRRAIRNAPECLSPDGWPDVLERLNRRFELDTTLWCWYWPK
jgi:hypothetical protein